MDWFLYGNGLRHESVKYKKLLVYNNKDVSLHCVKSVQKQSFLWSLFSRIWTEYGDLQSKYPYSVRKRENTDQKKLCIWTLFT